MKSEKRLIRELESRNRFVKFMGSIHIFPIVFVLLGIAMWLTGKTITRSGKVVDCRTGDYLIVGGLVIVGLILSAIKTWRDRR